MELVYSIIFLIIGYGFGSFSTGYVVGKMSGHNIQSEGSGNIGTTNALRTMGAKGGALTFAGFIKGIYSDTFGALCFLSEHGVFTGNDLSYDFGDWSWRRNWT